MLLAVASLILPIYLLYSFIDGGIFDREGKDIFTILFAWLFFCVAGWVGFQIWWNRKDKVLLSTDAGAEFPVTPIFSHFIQTLGEWLGAIVAIAGFGAAFIGAIIFGNELGHVLEEFKLDYFDFGVASIIVLPVLGFVIIVLFRFFAEMFRCLTSIANNTKK